MLTLKTPLAQVKGIGQAHLKLLTQAEKSTVADLLLFAPLRYENRQTIFKIEEILSGELTEGALVTLQARVLTTNQRWQGRRSLQRALLSDESGQLPALWFNSPYIIRQLKTETLYNLSGKWSAKYRHLNQATVEAVTANESIHTARIVPIYSSTIGIKPGWLRRILHQLFQELDTNQEIIAHLKQLHFPESEAKVIEARRRLALEEVLILLRQAQELKEEWRQREAVFAWAKTASSHLAPLLDQLPFSLTLDQKRALQAIITDLTRPYAMNRLLQGDVGVGKTIVAGLVAQLLTQAGQSVCLLAPTKILAQQHQASLTAQLPQLPLTLVTSRQRLLQPSDQPRCYLGTHALLNHLATIQPALIIFDEQQRFGVEQRSLMQALPRLPHVLTMTATPIPRSLMLTVFAQLSRSLIETRPPGRQITKTWFIPRKKEADAWRWIETQAQVEPQLVMVVCPHIQADEKNQISSTEAVFARLTQAYPTWRIGHLHGRLSGEEQSRVIKQAHAGELDLLVATSIIEVGVDLPQATIMVIESAERFGLASLHQLRGRVGRRGQQGYCLLFHSPGAESSSQRLQAFAKLSEGSAVAELDLKTRGPGDLLGIDQHGHELFQFANWVDLDLLQEARTLAAQLPTDWRSPLFIPPQQTPLVAQN